ELPEERRGDAPGARPRIVEGEGHGVRARRRALDYQPRDLIAGDRPVAVLGQILQPRLEPLARYVVKVEDGNHAAGRSAKEERGIAAGREIDEAAQGAATLGEGNS